MEDELASVNVSSKNMPGFPGDEEGGSLSVEVGTRSTDFGQDVSEDAVDLQTHKKESSYERGAVRTPSSAMEVLRRNFGTPKSSSVGRNGRVEAMLKNLERQPNAELAKTDCDDDDDEQEEKEKEEEEKSSNELPNFLTSLELEDADGELQDVEGFKGGEESCRSKEHVYCTVYCIENENFRKADDDASGLPSTDSPNPELVEELVEEAVEGPVEDDVEVEMYTLADLSDPTVLSSGEGYSVLRCRVCLDDRPIQPLHCCRKAVCEECLKTYITSQVHVGRADIACPITECSGYLEDSVVLSHLATEDLAKYKYFMELSRLDSSTKVCPQCSLFTSLKGRSMQAPSRAEQKYKIQCTKCQFVWCFRCHAPWHEGMKCREYRKGDKLLRHWASVIEHGQRNAQKCPRCKIHIQRTEGCDHMTCTQCNTSFCYRCGEKYRHLRFFGDHTSNLSVFGCKYRYLPEKPHLRRLVRGSVCLSKLLVAPLVIVLVVVVGALALVIGLVVFPIYYICKKRRKHSHRTGRWLC